jgi:Tfp pilus assembly protein PilV
MRVSTIGLLACSSLNLDSLQYDLDAKTRAQQMSQQHLDMLTKISNLFGLGS